MHLDSLAFKGLSIVRLKPVCATETNFKQTKIVLPTQTKQVGL